MHIEAYMYTLYVNLATRIKISFQSGHTNQDILSNVLHNPTMQAVEAGNACGGVQGASQMREGQVRVVNDTVRNWYIN
jgi:hypothetical protein